MRYFQAMNRGGLRALGTIAGSLFIGIPLLSHAANAQLYNYDQYNMNDEILPGTTLITPQDPTRQTLKPGVAPSATPTPAQPGVLQPPLTEHPPRSDRLCSTNEWSRKCAADQSNRSPR